ncbi:MAG TPA: HK97 gp10 family phage protein [Polyangia bacterium]|nr:HK97 gp10 family phage protein [Polyangia bacterium]
MAERVEIVGWADFQRDLKKFPEDVKKRFADEMKNVAEVVARAAAVKVPSKSGDAISTIRSKGLVTGASIAEGGSNAPYMQWLDFGSRTPRKGNSRDEGPWRGSGAGPKGGRFIYPAIDDKRAEIAKAVDQAVTRAAEGAGFT